MNRRIIALVGPSGCGKSTLAQLLVDHYYTRIRFADGIKTMLRALLQTQTVCPTDIDRMLEGDLKETPSDLFCGQTSRYAMQTLGTEWGRDLINKDFWINILARQVIDCPFYNVVIDDTRFKSEEHAIRILGGLIIRINRLDGPKLSIDHVSDTEHFQIKEDHTIVNDRNPRYMLHQLGSFINVDFL